MSGIPKNDGEFAGTTKNLHDFFCTFSSADVSAELKWSHFHVVVEL